MFLTSKRNGYTPAGQPFASGQFLLLVDTPAPEIGINASHPMRALVRFCSMQPLGNFMMGRVRVRGTSITMSGSYGNDGLPKSVKPEIYRIAKPVPPELIEAWNKGGGWNGAGSEASAMREWAIKAFGLEGRIGVSQV